jgi:hypothetical protein
MDLAYFDKIAKSDMNIDTNLNSFKFKGEIVFSDRPNFIAMLCDDTAFGLDFYIGKYNGICKGISGGLSLVGYLFDERAPDAKIFEQEELTKNVPLNADNNCFDNSGYLSCDIEDLLKQPRYIAQTTADEQAFISKVTHRKNNVTINLDAVIEDFLNLYYYNSHNIED